LILIGQGGKRHEEYSLFIYDFLIGFVQ